MKDQAMKYQSFNHPKKSLVLLKQCEYASSINQDETVVYFQGIRSSLWSQPSNLVPAKTHPTKKSQAPFCRTALQCTITCQV